MRRVGGVIMLRLMKEIFLLSNDPTANWQWIKGLSDVFKITFLRSALTPKPENQNGEINEPSIETEQRNLQNPTRTSEPAVKPSSQRFATQLVRFI